MTIPTKIPLPLNFLGCPGEQKLNCTFFHQGGRGGSAFGWYCAEWEVRRYAGRRYFLLLILGNLKRLLRHWKQIENNANFLNVYFYQDKKDFSVYIVQVGSILVENPKPKYIYICK